ncbi:hypothetical protein [Endozoicomonas euniceicola]|uniref:Uncharacterized protein n=1 Tax=Endozoicomonas euniceicola TaxID=1234143 RepID=A0ABY6GXX7_9GAMM|nr:hypothetical protein [Endozoicomonas euniceicola]UYM17632.1 hypothetical protein NX720_06920 [Endozoicomonas euniceicola]
MAVLKTMLAGQDKLFADFCDSLLPRRRQRRESGVRGIRSENLDRESSQEAKQELLEQIHCTKIVYRKLCQNRLAECQHSFTSLPETHAKAEAYGHYETFISETLELVHLRHELMNKNMEIEKKLEDSIKYTKKQSPKMTALKGRIKIINNEKEELKDTHDQINNSLLTSLLTKATTYYRNTNNEQALNELIDKNKEGFLIWLQNIDPEEITGYKLRLKIGMCMDFGELPTLQKLLNHLLLKIEEQSFEDKEILLILINCRKSFHTLSESKALTENQENITQLKTIVATFGQIIDKVIEHDSISKEDQALLKDVFNIEYQLTMDMTLLKFDYIIATLNSIGTNLVIDEQKEALKAQQQAERQPRGQRKKHKATQKKQSQPQPQKKQAQELTAATPLPLPTSTEQEIPPVVKEALEAFANKKTLSEISGILSPLINDSTASKFARAQACYCYADLVRVELSRAVRKNCENVVVFYQYGESIRQAGSSPAASMPELAMLDKFTEAIKELSTSQSLFHLIESMTESFSQALDIIATESEPEPDFLEALDRLHIRIQLLTSNMNAIATCCANSQLIYKERGELLKVHKKAGRQGKMVVNEQRDIEHNIQSIESVGVQLNSYLKPLNDKLASTKHLLESRRNAWMPQQDNAL